MLFPRDTLEDIAAGRITLAFRRWLRPRVLPGTRLRTAAGVVAIDAVEPVDEATLTGDDARGAGAASRDELLRGAPDPDRRLYRIRLHFEGDDPRIALREQTDLAEPDLAELRHRLARFDAASPAGPWTTDVLRLIAREPGTRAPDLAASLGRETLPFKRDVRKLKELGLTESLPVGYRLSPRGRAYLATIEPPPQ